MSSLLFAVGVVAFLVVVFWYVKNENRGDDEGASGFLATRKDDDLGSSDEG